MLLALACPPAHALFNGSSTMVPLNDSSFVCGTYFEFRGAPYKDGYPQYSIDKDGTPEVVSEQECRKRTDGKKDCVRYEIPVGYGGRNGVPEVSSAWPDRACRAAAARG